MSESAKESPANRRQHPRCRCAGGAEIFQNGSRWGWGSVNEISRGGCYIELIQLLPVGDPVVLKLSITDLSLEIAARIASNDPSTGMGMEFLDITPEQRGILVEMLTRLKEDHSQVMVDRRLEDRAPTTIRISQQSAPKILARVIERINEHGVVTRQELVAIVKDVSRS
jgi:hypothetical protein